MILYLVGEGRRKKKSTSDFIHICAHAQRLCAQSSFVLEARNGRSCVGSCSMFVLAWNKHTRSFMLRSGLWGTGDAREPEPVLMFSEKLDAALPDMLSAALAFVFVAAAFFVAATPVCLWSCPFAVA